MPSIATGKHRGATREVSDKNEDGRRHAGDRDASGLHAVLRQVDHAVRAAYATPGAVQLTIRLQSGTSHVDIASETLDLGPAALSDIESEQALLGSLLYDNEGFEYLGPRLTATDFYDPAHQRLFAAMLAFHKRGELAEPILIAEQMAIDPGLKELGGIRYLADLVDRAPPIEDVPKLSARVGGLAMRRQDIGGENELEAALSEANARGASRAAEVLAGPEMLSADDFAKLIGATRETVRQKLKRREILGLTGAKRGVRYPAWQVSDDGALLPDLPVLFALLGESPWTVYRFLTQPNPVTGGQPPLKPLRKGSLLTVLEAAEAQASGDFG